MTEHTLKNLAELKQLYSEPPSPVALLSELPQLDRHHRAYIALCPFVVIASAGSDGSSDVSPRGDLPGFVRVLDDHTLLLPDRPGNKKLHTLRNVVENASVSLLFMIPGRDETMRVTGTATITTDPALLHESAVQGHTPRSGLLIRVERAWLHCAKALIRSRLWDPEARVGRDALPSLGTMLADQVADVDADETDARLEKNNRAKLWQEAGS
jgi:PPOX class probable FMN-dependent enzyme